MPIRIRKKRLRYGTVGALSTHCAGHSQLAAITNINHERLNADKRHTSQFLTANLHVILRTFARAKRLAEKLQIIFLTPDRK